MKLKQITAFIASLIISSTMTVSYGFSAEISDTETPNTTNTETSVTTTTTTVSDSVTTSVTTITSTETTDTTEEKFTVTFLDFDGNIMNTQILKSGEPIDYSIVDTASLKTNTNPFTQRMFYSWDIQPETVEQDTVIQALYKEAVIALENTPEKTVYHSMSQDIDSSGLSVTITIYTQTNEFDENGERILLSEVTDISSSCTFSISNTKDAFAESDIAEIKIYPISSTVSVGSYQITFVPLMGDANQDGLINSSDASTVLSYYALSSMGNEINLTENQFKVSDVNSDSSINSSDASSILAYYAQLSSGGQPEWE